MISSSKFRRGSIYVATLGTSILVMVIGLGGIVLARIQARTGGNANDFAEARICSRSGLELGMLTIYNDPYWRTHLGNGTWFTKRPIGAGFFTLSAVDPVDSDVANGENDPLILTCAGMKGSAKYITSMRMEVSPRVGSCLEASLCSGDNLSINGATLTSDQTISSNAQVSASGGATVNAIVEAYKNISGSSYTQTTKVTGLKRTLPDPQHVLDYYIAHGTPISYTSLNHSNASDLIVNEKFENDTSGWYGVGTCTLKQSTIVYKEGSASLRVTSRKAVSAVAATDLALSTLVKGHSYAVKFPVYCAVNDTVHVTLTLTTSNGSFTFSTPDTDVPQNTWTDLSTPSDAPLTPKWTGTLTKATLTVNSSTVKDYYLDDVSFKDVTHPTDTYVMERQLLTPTNNPYGGATNPLGIYVINCGGKSVAISNCRIIGTLVMLNPAGSSDIDDSVIMEPAVANFPLLLTDGQFRISMASSPLSEDDLAVNFNPPGAPYPYLAGSGTGTNTTSTDSYPSSLNGLVYCKGNLTIDSGSTINGVVISGGKTQVNASSLALKYNNIYLNTAPPGFTIGTVQMKPVPGTWQRAVSP